MDWAMWVLVLLTAGYVVMTFFIAKAAHAQRKLAADQREALKKEDARRREANRYSSHIAAKRLLNELKRLPETPGVKPEIWNHPGWSVSQLGDLIGYARDVRDVDEADAMNAVSALNSLNEMIARIRSVNPRQGIPEKDLSIEVWRTDRDDALKLLEKIAHATKPEANAGSANA